MTEKWIGAFGRDLQRGCVYRLAAAAVVVPLFFLFILVPLYLGNRPGVTSREALWIMVIPAVLFLALMIGGSGLALYISIRCRNAWLDEAFSAFHLLGSSYVITGRQYHGSTRGRKMDVSFLRGPLLLIHLSTDLMTRMAVSDTMSVIQGLADLVNKEPIRMEADQLIVYPHEPAWAKVFLDDPQVRHLLVDLIFDEHPFLIRQVEFQPGTVTLRLYRSNKIFGFRILPEQARRWVSALLELIDLAEHQPAPAETLEPSALAASVRAGKTARYAWIIIAAVSVCVGVLAVAMVFLVQ